MRCLGVGKSSYYGIFKEGENRCDIEKEISPVRKSRTVLDSGFQAMDSGFQELDSSLCQWKLDFGFQSLVGFRITLSCIPDSKTQDS